MGVGAEAAETAAVIAAARYEYAECRRHDRFDVVVKGLKHDEIAGRHAQNNRQPKGAADGAASSAQ